MSNLTKQLSKNGINHEKFKWLIGYGRQINLTKSQSTKSNWKTLGNWIFNTSNIKFYFQKKFNTHITHPTLKQWTHHKEIPWKQITKHIETCNRSDCLHIRNSHKHRTQSESFIGTVRKTLEIAKFRNVQFPPKFSDFSIGFEFSSCYAHGGKYAENRAYIIRTQRNVKSAYANLHTHE